MKAKQETELLAREMRARALEISGYRVLTDQDLVDLSEELQKMYFNAGRWVAGDRDWPAREAFQKMNERENNADSNNRRHRRKR